MRLRSVGFWTIVALGIGSCTAPPRYRADVKLSIDGKGYDYTTQRVQIDQQVRDGVYSVYLFANESDALQPYINVRSYQANPVQHAWLRFADVADSPKVLSLFECFAPASSADGKSSLERRRGDGSALPRSKTGEDSCFVSVQLDGNNLQVTLDAIMKASKNDKERKQQAKAGDAQKQVTVRVRALVYDVR